MQSIIILKMIVIDHFSLCEMLFSRHPLEITYKTPKWSMDDRVVLY